MRDGTRDDGILLRFQTLPFDTGRGGSTGGVESVLWPHMRTVPKSESMRQRVRSLPMLTFLVSLLGFVRDEGNWVSWICLRPFSSTECVNYLYCRNRGWVFGLPSRFISCLVDAALPLVGGPSELAFQRGR
jgi:hypothetical protein